MSQVYNLEENGLAHRFNLCRHKIQVMGGGFGNGKTAALCVKAIQVATDYPGSNLLLARETYPKLNDTLRKEFYKWVPTEAVRRWPTKDDNTLYFKNGSTVNFRYISQRGKTSEDGSTTSNLLSATYDFVGIDQIEDPGIVEKDFFDIMGRLRGSTPYRGDDDSMPRSGPRWFIITCNPTSNWFYRRIIKPLKMFQEKGIRSDDLMCDTDGNPVIALFEGSTYTNRANLPDDFIEGMEATYTGQMRDRFLLGKWAAYEGLVYPTFSDEIHVLPQSYLLNAVREQAKRTRLVALEGYDFGMASPSCYLFSVVDAYGRVLVLDGFYKKEMSFDDQAHQIQSIRAKYTGLVDIDDPIVADPAIFKRTTMSGLKTLGTTVAEIFKSDYNLRMRPGDNSITNGIPKVSSYLQTYSTIPELVRGEKSALIYFAEELGFIAEEFGGYFWKKNPLNEAEDKPQDRNDHSLDAIKYMLSFRPKPGQIIKAKIKATPPWMFWNEEPDRPKEKVF